MTVAECPGRVARWWSRSATCLLLSRAPRHVSGARFRIADGLETKITDGIFERTIRRMRSQILHMLLVGSTCGLPWAAAGLGGVDRPAFHAEVAPHANARPRKRARRASSGHRRTLFDVIEDEQPHGVRARDALVACRVSGAPHRANSRRHVAMAGAPSRRRAGRSELHASGRGHSTGRRAGSWSGDRVLKAANLHPVSDSMGTLLANGAFA